MKTHKTRYILLTGCICKCVTFFYRCKACFELMAIHFVWKNLQIDKDVVLTFCLCKRKLFTVPIFHCEIKNNISHSNSE